MVLSHTHAPTHTCTHKSNSDLLMPSKFHVMSYGWENTKYIHGTQLIFQSNLGLILSGSNQDKEKLKLQERNIQHLCYYIKHVASNKNCLCKTTYYLFPLLYFMSRNGLGHTLFVLRVTHCSLSFAKHKHLHSMTDVKIWAFKLLCYLFFKLE